MVEVVTVYHYTFFFTRFEFQKGKSKVEQTEVSATEAGSWREKRNGRVTGEFGGRKRTLVKECGLEHYKTTTQLSITF